MLTRELGEGERTHTHFWRQKQRIAAKKKKGIGTVVPFSPPLFCGMFLRTTRNPQFLARFRRETTCAESGGRRASNSR